VLDWGSEIGDTPALLMLGAAYRVCAVRILFII